MGNPQLNGLTYTVEKRYRGADLAGIGTALREEWGLSAADADEAVRAFFEEVAV